MKEVEEILWTGKCEVIPNVWGLANEGGRLRLSMLNGTGHSQAGPGYLGMLFWMPIVLILGGFIFYAVSIIFMIVYVTGLFLFIMYWVFIREIKYYQLAKNTRYEITKSHIRIIYSFLGIRKVTTVLLEDIHKTHVVKYVYKDQEKGSIWLYINDATKDYQILKKERSNMPRIEVISEYRKVHELINKLREGIM